jgi:hypothetical protein
MRYGKWFLAFGMLVGGLAHAPAATAQERAVSFANLRFGTRPAVVLETMKQLKLASLAGTPDQQFPFDQRFEGELRGTRVLVSALYDPDGALEKVMVAFLTPDEECVALYRVLKQELKQEYGAPFVDVERWEYPYANGGHVGQEHFAIRLGRGMLAAAWDRDDAGSRDGGVTLITSESVIVRLAYESSKWAAESERRKKLLGLADSENQTGSTDGTTRQGSDPARISGEN